uniref:Uncharacterized protein n=1 Tax=Arundo donax TaxID=35708 RepID=A0A0A9BQ39_ARUDO
MEANGIPAPLNGFRTGRRADVRERKSSSRLQRTK